jgi:hypothetical protein
MRGLDGGGGRQGAGGPPKAGEPAGWQLTDGSDFPKLRAGLEQLHDIFRSPADGR